MKDLEKYHLEQPKSCFRNEYITITYNIGVLGIGSELLDSFPEDLVDMLEERRDINLDLSGEEVDLWLDGDTLIVEGKSARIKIQGISEIKSKISRLGISRSKALA